MYKIAVISRLGIMRESIKDILAYKDYEVQDFISEDEFYQQYSEKFGIFDLFILDITSNEEQVFTTIKQIRESVFWTRIPIIVTSSESSRETIVNLLRKGADDFVLKPFSPEKFINRISRLLTLYHAEEVKYFPSAIMLNVDQLFDFEIARADRGNYPLSFISIYVNELEYNDNPREKSVNTDIKVFLAMCYELLRKTLRKTDLIFGSEDSLIISLPFTCNLNIIHVINRVKECLSGQIQKYQLFFMEISHASFPANGSDTMTLQAYSASKKSIMGS